MKKNRTFRLERRLPNGEIKAWSEPMKLRDAGRAVAWSVTDNESGTRVQATAVAMAVESGPVGTWVPGPKYDYRLTEES